MDEEYDDVDELVEQNVDKKHGDETGLDEIEDDIQLDEVEIQLDEVEVEE